MKLDPPSYLTYYRPNMFGVSTSLRSLLGLKFWSIPRFELSLDVLDPFLFWWIVFGSVSEFSNFLIKRSWRLSGYLLSFLACLLLIGFKCGYGGTSVTGSASFESIACSSVSSFDKFMFISDSGFEVLNELAIYLVSALGGGLS